MAVFKCKMCGGALEIKVGDSVAVCEYCNTKQTLPRLDDDRRAQLYDRANYFRRENEFDKAMGVYEMILSDDKSDCESYWGIVLCRYGIEYVEDPRSHKRIPTVNRAQFTSIFEDEDYKNAIKYADALQKEIYEAEASVIDKIQKGILAISQKEEPFDVFICCKETDSFGNRTQDSVYAQDIYNALIKEGYKVFFSRITLEDKLGSAYEPYIFAALNSAKVMLVVGTTKDNFNAVWVKNEWSRFISLIQSGKEKTLIPVYKDISPYEMPEEFQYLQSQDMGKIGFIQDLVRGVQKIIGNEQKTASVQTPAPTIQTTNVVPLLKRAFMFLEDGDFERADEFCEQVLNIDPENAQAYLGKLLVEFKACKVEDLGKCDRSFENSVNYQKVIRFGNDKIKVILANYLKSIEENIKKKKINGIYQQAVVTMSSADTVERYKEAINEFKKIPTYKDSSALIEQCNERIEKIEKKQAQKQELKRLEKERREKEQRELAEKRKKNNKIIAGVISSVIVLTIVLNTVAINMKYNNAVALIEAGQYKEAIIILDELDNYKDSVSKIDFCNNKINELDAQTKENEYNAAVLKMNSSFAVDRMEAAKIFYKLDTYKDSKSNLSQVWEYLLVQKKISTSQGLYTDAYSCGIDGDGNVVCTNSSDTVVFDGWRNCVEIDSGNEHTVALSQDGYVYATGNNDYNQLNVTNWAQIKRISAGGMHTLGLKGDGTVVSTTFIDEYLNQGQTDVEAWGDIVDVSAGYWHSVGLKADGTVVAVGNNSKGQCNVQDWCDVIQVEAGPDYTIALKADGTVLVTGKIYEFHTLYEISTSRSEFEISLPEKIDWSDIKQISAGVNHFLGLKYDGTVVAIGDNEYDQCDVDSWKNIRGISAGVGFTVAINSKGESISVGNNDDGQCNVSDWKDIKIPD